TMTSESTSNNAPPGPLPVGRPRSKAKSPGKAVKAAPPKPAKAEKAEKAEKAAKPAKAAKAAKPETVELAPRAEKPAKPEKAERAERAEKASPTRRATAETMATRQRDISVSEFFTKNRHLLGFDNPAKALLTTVKEAVDNSLDA